MYWMFGITTNQSETHYYEAPYAASDSFTALILLAGR